MRRNKIISTKIMPEFPNVDNMSKEEQVRVIAQWFNNFYNRYISPNNTVVGRSFYISKRIDDAFFTRENATKLLSYVDIYCAYEIHEIKMGRKRFLKTEQDIAFVRQHLNRFKRAFRGIMKEKGITHIVNKRELDLLDSINNEGITC